MTDTLYYTTHNSSIGKLVIVAGARGIRYISMLHASENGASHLAAKFRTPPVPTLLELGGFFESAMAEIDRYLAGEITTLDLPYELAEGTHLQRAVWLAIAKIPYGETVSYSILAERVGFPRAIRAVASACGSNPIPLIIPCHRVVAKDGSLAGFSLGGVEVKEQLLQTESHQRQKAAA